jgi:hypothetical protein|nr:MAG TPA: hypothetical protein [Bacteriophage sp.]
MIQPILINYYITDSNDYCNCCGELHYLKIYTGTGSSGLGLFKALYSFDMPLHAYAIIKVEEDGI